MKKYLLVIVTLLLISNLILAAEVTESFSQPIEADKFLIFPGEQITVTFISSKLEPLTLSVNAEGKIVDKTIGIINLTGKTLSEAKLILIEAVRKQFNVADISISVGPPIATSIAIYGAIYKPGIYLIKNSLRVSDLIKKAGGLLPEGSSRRILFKNNSFSIAVDLDRSKYLGEAEADPFLYAGIEVYIPNKRNNRIKVAGEVNRPRDIEFIEGDKLELILKLAGGLSSFGDIDNISVIRGNQVIEDHQLIAGDVVIVPPVNDYLENMVAIFGAVTNPGHYSIDKSITLEEILELSGGLQADANRNLLTIFRRPRVGLDGRVNLTRYPITQPIIAQKENLIVKTGDSIYVPVNVGFIKISGEITNPGFYPYVENANIEYYITTAGGLLPTSDSELFLLYNPLAKTTIKSSEGVVVPDGAELIIKKSEVKQ